MIEEELELRTTFGRLDAATAREPVGDAVRQRYDGPQTDMT